MVSVDIKFIRGPAEQDYGLVPGVDSIFIIKSILIGYGLSQFVLTYTNTMNVLKIF